MAAERGDRQHRARVAAVIAAIAAIAVLVAGPRAAAGGALGPNLSLTGDPAQVQNNPTIAVDRGNPLRLVAAANTIKGNWQVLFWSGDGGNSWGSSLMPHLPDASYHWYPSVAWDSKGTAYATPRAAGGTPYHQADLDNRLHAVAGGGRRSQFSWTDVAGNEVSYRVYRSVDR